MLVATAAGICFFGGVTFANAAPSFHASPHRAVASVSSAQPVDARGDLKRRWHKGHWTASYRRPFEYCNGVGIVSAGWIVGLAAGKLACAWPAQWDPFALSDGWLFA